jgi:hypothetical protein
MPTDSHTSPASETNKPLDNDFILLENISEGKFSGYINLINFKEILNLLLFETLPSCKDRPSNHKEVLECIIQQTKQNATIQHLEGLSKTDQLSNIFKYFTRCINELEGDINLEYKEKLVKLDFNFLSISRYKELIDNDTLIELIGTDEKNIHSYINYRSILTILPDISKIKLEDGYNIVDTISSPAKLLTKLISFNKNATTKNLPTNNYRHPIFEPLANFLDSLGRLAFHFRDSDEAQHHYHRIVTTAQELIEIEKTAKQLNSEELNHVAWGFLNHLHDGNENYITGDCEDIFNLNDCQTLDSPQITEIYNTIINGVYSQKDLNYFNFQTILDKLLKGSSSKIEERLESLSLTKSLSNVSIYFTKYLDLIQKPVSSDHLKKLFRYFTHIGHILSPKSTKQKNTDRKLDSYYYQKVLDQFTFLLRLVRSRKNTETTLLTDQIHITMLFGELLKEMMDNHKRYKSLDNTDWFIDKLLASFFDIVDHSIDNPGLLSSGCNDFKQKITDLSDACLNLEVCNSIKTLERAFENLGTMAYRLGLKEKINYVEGIKETAKDLKENAIANLQRSEQELSGVVWIFLNRLHAGNQTAMDIDCKKIFQLDNCNPFIPSNTTTAIPETTITTTSTAIPVVNTSTAVPVTNQTTPAVIVDHTVTTELPDRSNSSMYNQTVTETIENSSNDTALSVSEASLIASAGFGGTLGFYNGIMRHFFPNSIALNIVGHSVIAATFPIMLLGIQQQIAQGNEAETQVIWDNMLWQAPTTFVNTFMFNTGLHLLNILTDVLSNRPKLHSAAQNTVPFVGTACNLYTNPAATATQMGTAWVVSYAISGILNGFFPEKKRKPMDVEAGEKNAVELQLLNQKETKNNTIDLNTVVNAEKDLTSIEIFFQKNKFITEENVKDIRNNLEIVIEKTDLLSKKMLNATLKNQLNQLLETTILGKKIGLTPDVVDLSAFISSNLSNCEEQNNSEQAILRTPENLKTLLQTIQKSLIETAGQQPSLSSILSKIEGSNPETLIPEVSDLIQLIKTYMHFITSKIKPALSNSPTQIIFNSSTAIPRRKTKEAVQNRAYSMYSDRTHSSGSDKSDASGNSEFDPLFQQQGRELIRPKI